MHGHLNHHLEAEREIVFKYSPDAAYLAMVDLKSYPFFVSENLEYEAMFEHLGRQMTACTCVAWGCPEGDLVIRVVFTHEPGAFEAVTNYAAGIHGWIRTQGRLCFCSHRELWRCAREGGWDVFDGPDSPEIFLPRELIVPAGIYSLTVFRHFPWFEGAQDAPYLNQGVHYTLILRQYESSDADYLLRGRRLSHVPWTNFA